MIPEPQVGDTVDVTIRAQIGRMTPMNHGAPVLHLIYRGTTVSDELAVRADYEAVTIEIVEPACPAAWPPRVGDLWRDRHAEVWFGIDARDLNNPSTPVVELVGLWGERLDPAVMHRDRGPLALVRRETDDPAVRDCSMDTYDCGCDHADDGESELQPEEVRLLARQIDGWACIRCGSAPGLDQPMKPAGIVDGRQVFWCAADCRTTVETASAQHPAWPPRAGDVWRDDDCDEWTAVNTPGSVELRLYDEHTPVSADDVLSSYGPLELVRRK